jgi:hypothetical protein
MPGSSCCAMRSPCRTLPTSRFCTATGLSISQPAPTALSSAAMASHRWTLRVALLPSRAATAYRRRMDPQMTDAGFFCTTRRRDRGDGPDRVHQDRQGFQFRDAAGGPAARPSAALRAPRRAGAARRARGRDRRRADGAATCRAAISALGDWRELDFGPGQVVLMRKDPPVDADYLHDTQLLGMAQRARRAGGQRPAGPARLQRETGRAAVPAMLPADAGQPRRQPRSRPSSANTARRC